MAEIFPHLKIETFLIFLICPLSQYCICKYAKCVQFEKQWVPSSIQVYSFFICNKVNQSLVWDGGREVKTWMQIDSVLQCKALHWVQREGLFM